jgi:hypothetical protein
MKARSRSSSIPIKRSSGRKLFQPNGEAWTCGLALRRLQDLGEQRNVEGMARFGIRTEVV